MNVFANLNQNFSKQLNIFVSAVIPFVFVRILDPIIISFYNLVIAIEK